MQLLPSSLHIVAALLSYAQEAVSVSSRATTVGQHTDFVTTLSDAELLQDWIDSTAEFLKSLDSNHLITVGSEGFLGSSTPGKNLLLPSIASPLLTSPSY
jgi:hypothetical protein